MQPVPHSSEAPVWAHGLSVSSYSSPGSVLKHRDLIRQTPGWEWRWRVHSDLQSTDGATVAV